MPLTTRNSPVEVASYDALMIGRYHTHVKGSASYMQAFRGKYRWSQKEKTKKSMKFIASR
jgi:hypothetical protein